MYAARRNARDAAAWLIEHGVNLDHQNDSGATAVNIATYNGHLELVKLLLENKADCMLAEKWGWQPIHRAAAMGRLQIVKELLRAGADIEARSNSKQTPLLCAIQERQRDVASFLVAHGANLKARGFKTMSALHLAVHAASLPLVRFLVQAGADMEAKTPDGASPLHTAVQLGKGDVTALLLQYGANINTVTKKGWTPVHLAASHGSNEVLKTLLAHGPDLTITTNKGLLPNQLARKSVKALLDQTSSADSQVVEEPNAELSARLVAAASHGNLPRVVRLLENGMGIDTPNIDGRRAASSAAENGHSKILELLLQRGADPNLKDPTGESALWWASRYGYEEAVRLLISFGADINAMNRDGQSPLSVAAQKHHSSIVSILLQQGCVLDSSVAYGRTALIFAVVAGSVDVVEQLLKAGANVNFKTTEGDTAVSLAQEQENDNVLHLLRKHGGLLPTELNGGKPALTLDSFPEHERVEMKIQMRELHQAASKGRIPEVLRLIKAGTPLDGSDEIARPLLSAVIAGHMNVIEMLVKHGASLDVKGKDEATCLGIAVSWGQEAVLRFLLKQGADIEEICDNRGRTPISVAAAFGHLSLVQLLLKLGAKIEWKDWDKMTPLLRAVRGGHRTVVEHLVQHGANIECVDETGTTPLNAAVKCGNREIAQFLLDRGAQMRPDSVWNARPLAFAAFGGSEAIVQLLIDRGADLDHQNDYQKTALHWAVEKGHSMVVKILIEAGARVDIQDDFSRDPLSLAKEKCQEACVKLLSQVSSLRKATETQHKETETAPSTKRDLYQYRSLPAEGYIRIIELLPGVPGDIISIELDDVPLDNAPPFEALSYEWREKVNTIPIQCDNKAILVTPNCKAAMENLRHVSESRSLWIDAICINQGDLKERSEQVGRMADIYRRASSVLMWLGDDYGANSIGLAFENMENMVRVHEEIRREPVETSTLVTPMWEHEKAKEMARRVLEKEDVANGFKDLHSRQYFTRAWIFQEATLAGPRGIIICGRHQCPWRRFEPAMIAYGAYTMARNDCFMRIVQHDYSYTKYGRLSMELAIRAMTLFDSSDPRDKIFAILKLAISAPDSPLYPAADYTLTTQEVFIKTARYLIQDDDEGVGCWDWRNRRDSKTVSGLPSWVPDFSQKEKGLDLYPFQDPEPEFDEMITGLPTTTTTSLVINGCIIDKVAFRWTITTETDVMSVILPAIQALADQGKGLFDPYLDRPTTAETLIAKVLISTILESDVSPDEEEEDADILSYIVWRLAAHKEMPGASPFIPQSLQDAITGWDMKSKTMANFDLEICQAMDVRLQFDTDLILTEKGHLGLTNAGGAKEGLLVAIVGGSETLCLLEERKQEGERFFEYVDLCWLRNFDGQFEALDKIANDLNISRMEIR